MIDPSHLPYREWPPEWKAAVRRLAHHWARKRGEKGYQCWGAAINAIRNHGPRCAYGLTDPAYTVELPPGEYRASVTNARVQSGHVRFDVVLESERIWRAAFGSGESGIRRDYQRGNMKVLPNFNREEPIMAKRKHVRAESRQRGVGKFAGHLEIVGGFYQSMWDAKVDGKLDIGAGVKLVREGHNRFDENAVAAYTADGKTKIGYVAKEEAAKLAAFMDCGCKVYGRILSLTDQPQRATIRLYVIGR